MTIEQRRSLPLTVPYARGKRSPVTCALKCANACTGPECNTSQNQHFRDIASLALTRRQLLGLGAAGAVTLAVSNASGVAGNSTAASASAQGFQFTPIAPVDASVDAVTIPTGFQWAPIIRWGDPVVHGAPPFDPAAQTAAAQATQFGYNNDYLDIIVDQRGGRRTAVLVANHEYVNPGIMFPPTADPAVIAEQRRITKAAQGMAVVELTRRRIGAPWTATVGARSRRVTMDTRFELTGPAAGTALVQTVADPSGRVVLGTLGNCAGGTTPWGTVLSGEENFNGYFVTPTSSPERARYGLGSQPTATGWEEIDPRFRATGGYENESNRFGYIVEIDPRDPNSTPKKHTALGRFKHEGANIRIAPDGRAIAYMGDDERGDYLYKFVSRDRFMSGQSVRARQHNMTLLTNGDLFVAKFTGDSPVAEINGSGTLPADGAFDGSGTWIPLTRQGQSAVPGMTIEQVLVYTRLAADLVGPTKMDRCEDVEPHPTSGHVYVACTNNSQRGSATQPVDEANPRTGNRDGHVIEIIESGGGTGTAFGWNIMLLCGDPASPSTYFAGFPKDQVSPISCPDNVAFDSTGDLWISTDGQPSTLGLNDGLFRVGLSGDRRGKVEQFLAVPVEAETCGPVIHDQEGMVFVAVQHPGENGAWGAQHSLFPDYGPGSLFAPRPSVIQVWRA